MKRAGPTTSGIQHFFEDKDVLRASGGGYIDEATSLCGGVAHDGPFFAIDEEDIDGERDDHCEHCAKRVGEDDE